MTITRFIRVASRSILYGLMFLLLWGCRASREAQTEEAQLPSEGTMLTYDAEAVGFPPHTFIFTLPLVPAIEEYRFELTPIRLNTTPGTVCRMNGRLVSTEQRDSLNYYVYDGEADPITSKVYTHGAPPIETQFCYGEPLLLPFRGNRRVAVTMRDSVRLGYRYWRAVGAPQEASPSETYTQTKEGFLPYRITAPEGSDAAEDYYIELIPSKLMKVDCNIHTLNGRFELLRESTATLSYTFHSDGTTLSTKMGCPDDTLEEKLIRHPGIIVRRPRGAAVEVLLPKGFTLRYRLYAPEGAFVLLASPE